MTTPNISDIIAQIEHLMYGFNFEVCLGVDLFEGCTIEDFKTALKKKYPSVDLNYIQHLVPIDKEELIADIKDKLNYRGDSHAGLSLSKEKETSLLELQASLITYINRFLDGSKSYSCPFDESAIPGYPVFWNYCYAVFSNNSIMFTYGSASD